MNKRWSTFLWMLFGLLVLGLLALGQGAWAQPGEDPAHQTVPTATPVRPPTATPPRPTPAPPVPGGPAPYLHLEADAVGVLPGGAFRYRATVGNAGEGPAQEARLILYLPQVLTLRTVEPPGAPVEVTMEGVVVPLGDLAPGEERVLEFHVQVGREVPLGAVLEAWAELVWAGGRLASEAVYVALPPGTLPVTGGAHPLP